MFKSKIERFVIWICSKFTRSEIELMIKGLSDVLANRNPNVKPKDDFKQKHPNYQNFFVDPNPPITKPTQPSLAIISAPTPSGYLSISPYTCTEIGRASCRERV